MHLQRLVPLAALALLQSLACSNSVGDVNPLDPVSEVDAGFDWPELADGGVEEEEDDVATISFDAILYRRDPQVPKNYLAASIGSDQYRYDHVTREWMPKMDRLQTPWADDPNGPLYDDPETAINERLAPLHAAFYRRDLANGQHFVGFVRGGMLYRYDYLLGAWRNKVDKIANGKWSDDVNAPFYNDPYTAVDESVLPVDGMFYRRDPSQGWHILSFVRGSVQYRYHYGQKAWLEKIDRRQSGQWSSDVNSPFYEDETTELLEASAPLDATFYRDDPENGEHHLGFVRGHMLYTFEISDKSWSPRIDMRASPLWVGGLDAPFQAP